MSVLFVFILFAFLTIATSFATGAVYLLYYFIKAKVYKEKPLSNPTERMVRYTLVIGTLLFSSYHTYRAFYPTDSFYFDEFRQVTLREPPLSAQIIKNDATYPDFHGDYSSTCQIKLTKAEYLRLLNEIESDKRLSKQPPYNYRFTNNKKSYASFNRTIEGEEDQHLKIFFLDDFESIIIKIDVT